MTQKHEFHVYASTKTTTQLFFDLASACSHVFTVFVLLNIQAEKRELLWSVLFYLVLSTIGLQVILAIGLFTLRLMTLDYEAAHNGIPGRTAISRWAHRLNNIGFYACLLVALLEVLIAGLEKLGLDNGHSGSNGSQQCPVLEVRE